MAERRIFISYAWPQAPPPPGEPSLSEKADAVADSLLAAGYAIWQDTHSMAHDSSDGIDVAMGSAISEADLIVCCMSAAYATRPNCRKELDFAVKQRKHIVYVNCGEGGWTDAQCTGADIWLAVNVGQALWADCRTRRAMADGLKTLGKLVADQLRLLR